MGVQLVLSKVPLEVDWTPSQMLSALKKIIPLSLCKIEGNEDWQPYFVDTSSDMFVPVML
jgi:hypothetical protein